MKMKNIIYQIYEIQMKQYLNIYIRKELLKVNKLILLFKN